MRSLVWVVALGGLVAAPLSAGVLLAVPAAAATVVSTPADLAAAWTTATSIQFANDITLTCSTSQLDRSATSGDVVVDGQGHTLSETCANRPTLVVLLGSSDNVTLQNLTLTTDGASLAGGFEMDGGTGNLTLNGVTMTNNHNTGGGAVEMQSGSSANLTIQNSTLSNNASCGSNGGAIEYSPAGNVVISGSTISNNQTGGDGGAIAMDGASRNLAVTNSTITGNTASSVGGLEVDNGNLTLTYVTNVNNTTDVPFDCADSAAASQRADGNPGPVEAPPPDRHHSQLGSQAVGDTPANLRIDQPSSTLTTFGSVIAQPHGGPNCGDFGGPPTAPLTNTVSNGWNFADDQSCGLTGTGDSQVTTNDPMLGPLTNNGGRNPTLLPQTGSPLIDKIPLASCQAGVGITIDERMLPRPSGPGCDIGAVEIQVAAIVVTPRFTG